MLCISLLSYIDISAVLLITNMQDVLPLNLGKSENPSLAASWLHGILRRPLREALGCLADRQTHDCPNTIECLSIALVTAMSNNVCGYVIKLMAACTETVSFENDISKMKKKWVRRAIGLYRTIYRHLFCVHQNNHYYMHHTKYMHEFCLETRFVQFL